MRAILRSTGIAAALAVLMLSTACSANTAGTAGKGVDPTDSQPPASADLGSPVPPTTGTTAPTSPAASTNQSTFGQTYQWTDGLSVTVSEPAFFVPGTYAAVKPATGYLRFRITVVNNTGEVYEPALFMATAQSGTQEGDRVFDTDIDLGVPPGTALLPGRQSTFDIGFGVSDPLDVVLQVRPDFEYEHAFFVSAPGSAPAAAESVAAPPEPIVPTSTVQGTSGDLALSEPMTNPACDGSGIVLLFASVTPGAYATEIQQALDRFPGSSYLRTDQTCMSLTQSTASGNPIYAVYRDAGLDRASVCAAVEAAGGDAYGKWLDNTTDPELTIDC